MRAIARSLMASCATIAALAGVPAAAHAATEPWWHLESGARPSVLPAGSGGASGRGELVLSAENVGDSATNVRVGKNAVVIADHLPAGLKAVGIAGTQPARGGTPAQTVALSCSLEALTCETSTPVAPFDQLEVRIAVEVLPGAGSGEVNAVSITGGGAPPASVSQRIAVGSGPLSFGVERYGLALEGEGGSVERQAGSHPLQATGTIALDQGADAAPLSSAPLAAPVAAASSLSVQLPPGLIANPGVVPRCLSWQFSAAVNGGQQNECSYQSAVGVASVTFDDAALGQTVTLPTPIFDIEPEVGEPARFGFYVPLEGVPVVLATGVRSGPGEDWGVNLTASGLPAGAGLIGARLTFWGVPGNSAHNEARGWGCLAEARGRSDVYEGCVHEEVKEPAAFVTLPTACSGPLQSSLDAVSWTGESGDFSLAQPLPEPSDCEQLAFTPSLSVSPSTHDASSPSGLSLALSFDTEGLTSGEGLAQSDLQDTSITLPEGLTIDPSAGVGLGACTEAQYAEATLSSAAAAGCPEDSKLGTVEIETPLLFTTLYGTLYVAQPYENPFPEAGHPGGSLIALYVIARSRAERGILIKLAGRVSANPVTGQLSVSFEGDPELPFSRFAFRFREGAQAPLISPATCDTFTTAAQLTPYANPLQILGDAASFQITSGSEGRPCPSGSLPPFEPSIRAGTLDNQAGVFSPFYVELSRTDDQQEIAAYSASLPVGVTADLTGVPFCPEADIEAARQVTGAQEQAQPSCPASSLIGHTVVGTGVGSVLDYVPGVLYFAGPFHGDPYSVVSITSAVIGPFDLGTIVIRFGLKIDPYTAQVSIDPTGSEPIPTIIDGIVTHVRDIKVSIDRPSFTLNPTSCESHPVSSTLSSSDGVLATVSTPFQEAGCHELSFKPTLTASTNGKTSRRRGASLSVKLTTKGALGSVANIKYVKVELPKQLPAELATLQHACAAQQFEENPAGCPAHSIVGYAKASTPILPVPLEGPAIFVSHGGAEFPSLVVVLQGYHVTIDLVGSTFINEKTGVISTTFKTVPDEPVGSFQLHPAAGQQSRAGGGGEPVRADPHRARAQQGGRPPPRGVAVDPQEGPRLLAADADDLHRPERREDPADHPDPGGRVRA